MCMFAVLPRCGLKPPVERCQHVYDDRLVFDVGVGRTRVFPRGVAGLARQHSSLVNHYRFVSLSLLSSSGIIVKTSLSKRLLATGVIHPSRTAGSTGLGSAVLGASSPLTTARSGVQE